MEEAVANFLGQFSKWPFHICIEMFRDGEQRTLQICRSLFVSRSHKGEFVGGTIGIRNQLGWINFEDCAQPVTTFAGAVSGIERERSRLERGDVDTANHASHPFRVKFLFAIDSSSQEAILSKFLQFFLELTLTAAHDWRQDHDPFTFSEAENILDNLLNALSRDGRSTFVTVRLSY